MPAIRHRAPAGNPTITIDDLRLLYSDATFADKRRAVRGFGPLEEPFLTFLQHEQRLQPLCPEELIFLFDSCIDPSRPSPEILASLRGLAPGGGRVGFREVNTLVDHLRNGVAEFLGGNDFTDELLPHDHAFGSGGDFWKTSHATTGACIVAAPMLPICKTGTSNVTAAHGSLQIARELGYPAATPVAGELNNLLSQFGFAFVPLQALGVPYSSSLRTARKQLWCEAVGMLNAEIPSGPGSAAWSHDMRSINIPLDVFKVVSPNAQVLNPAHHSTGVCHLSMIPYVLGIYLHLGSRGLIVHCYDGIDELCTAAANRSGIPANNLVIRVDHDRITVAELGPEDLGLPRSSLQELKEEDTAAEGSRQQWNILAGETGAKRDFLVANAAALLVAGDLVPDSRDDLVAALRAGARVAEHLLDSGVSHRNFADLLASAPHG